MTFSYPAIHQTEVSGIPTFWSSKPGPIVAGIVFRVGTVDEILAEAGITHLVEHLTLLPMQDIGHPIHGIVTDVTTTFMASGTWEQVSRFFAALSDSLRSLPLDRLDTERAVLQKQLDDWAPSVFDGLAAARYGVSGLGMNAYPQMGISHLQAERINEWKNRYFTRKNATLWITGKPPQDLDIDLPEGEFQLASKPHPLQQKYPAFVQDSEDSGIAISLSTNTGPAVNAAARVLHRRVDHELRIEKGFAYELAVSVVPSSAENCDLSFASDVGSQNNQESLEIVLAILDDLSQNGATQEELSEFCSAENHRNSDSGLLEETLGRFAQQRLFGHRFVSLEESAQLNALVMPVDVAKVITDALPTALAMTPELPNSLQDRFTKVPNSSTFAVEGKKYRLSPVLRLTQYSQLTVGEDGFTLIEDRDEQREMHTILYADCVAYEALKNSTRVFYGRDGTRITISPLKSKTINNAVQRIEQSLDPSLRIPVTNI